MRIYIISIFIYLFSLNLNGQIQEGQYESKENVFIIKDDTISFEFETNKFIRMLNRGLGTYKVIDDYLIIKSIKYPGTKSRVIDSIPGSKDLTTISFKTTITSQNVIGYDSNGNSTKSYQINASKDLIISSEDKVKSLIFSTYGYDPLILELIKGYDYTVEIVEGVTIENQNLVFKIDNLNQTSIGLTLLDIKAEEDQIVSIKALKY